MPVPAVWAEEDGQDLIEYSLLMMFVILATLALIVGGRPGVNAVWQAGNTHLVEAAAAVPSH